MSSEKKNEKQENRKVPTAFGGGGGEVAPPVEPVVPQPQPPVAPPVEPAEVAPAEVAEPWPRFASKLQSGDPHPPRGRVAAYRFAGFDPTRDVDPAAGRLWPGVAGFEARRIVRIYPPRPLIYAGQPISRITANAAVAPFLRAALQEIDATSHWSAIETYGGGFEPRLIRGGTSWSMHTLGLAWDFDPERNPLGAPPEATYFGSTPAGRWVVDCFHAWGFYWGGRFEGRKDCQHFQFVTGA